MRQKVSAQQLGKHPVHWLAFGFGTGLAPFAPGTFGTLAGLLFYLLFQYLHWISFLALILAAFFLGILICDKASAHLGVHDHPGIVWDEMVGYWLTMLAAPPGWTWIILGFVLFRFFDILKPWPIRWLDQRVSGGLGIMLDDLVAGAFSLLLLQLLHRWLGG